MAGWSSMRCDAEGLLSLSGSSSSARARREDTLDRESTWQAQSDDTTASSPVAHSRAPTSGDVSSHCVPEESTESEEKAQGKNRKASCKYKRGSFESRIPVVWALATSAVFAIRLPAHSKERRERSEGKDRARLHTKLDRNTPPTAPRRRTPTHARTHPKHTQTQQHVGPLRDVPGRGEQRIELNRIANTARYETLADISSSSFSLCLCLSLSRGRQLPNRIRIQTLRITPRSPASCFPHPCSSVSGTRSRSARAPSPRGWCHPQRRRPPRPRRRRRIMRPRRRFTGSACG